MALGVLFSWEEEIFDGGVLPSTYCCLSTGMGLVPGTVSPSVGIGQLHHRINPRQVILVICSLVVGSSASSGGNHSSKKDSSRQVKIN